MDTNKTDGLITLTEERLRDVLCEAYLDGQSDNENHEAVLSEAYASRIIEALGKEG